MPTILGNDSITLPAGTTAQRPTGAAGMIRMNTTINAMEYWDAGTSTWATVGRIKDGSTQQLAAPSGEYLRYIAGITTNGYYWITVGGTPKSVYCDLAGGGWMYLIPPTGATDTNPFGITFSTTSTGPTSCVENHIYQDLSGYNWAYYYSYRCGSANVSTTLSWTNNMGTRQVRLAAVIGGGNTRTFTLNGSTYGANRTNSANNYYSDSSPTCGTNSCWRANSTHWSQATPRTFTNTGNLSVNLYAAYACSPDCNWGVSVGIGNMSIK